MPMTVDEVADVYWSTLDRCLVEQGVTGETTFGGLFGRQRDYGCPL